MPHRTTFLANLLAATLCTAGAALAQQPLFTTTAKASAPKPTSPATAASSATDFRRHKATDFCTTAPRSEWFDIEEMKLLIAHRGYRVKTFKISKTNCYEIYGFDNHNHVVEAYFDPVSTRLLLQNEVQ